MRVPDVVYVPTPERVVDAMMAPRMNARAAGVEDRVTFVEGDLFEVDFSGASVVTLYLLPEPRLRTKLLALPPGTGVVSHAFDRGDWKPERTPRVDGSPVYAWAVPERRAPQARSGR